MSAPGRLDPLLAFLDFLHGYRRSWRCWLIGGPAAVDDLAVTGVSRAAAVRLHLDFEEGTEHTEADGACPHCYGTGVRKCPECRGTGWARPEEPDEEEGGAHRGGRVALCTICEGTGEIPCRQRYRSVDTDVLPPGAWPDEVFRLLKRAWTAPGQHIARVRAASGALVDALRRAHVAGEETCEEVLRVCRKTGARVAERRPGTHLFRRVAAEVADAGCVTLRLDRATGEFWAVGTGHSHRCQMRAASDFRLRVKLGQWLFQAFMAFGAFRSLHRLVPPWHALGLHDVMVGVVFGGWMAWLAWGHVTGQDPLGLISWGRHALRSLRRGRTPTIAVVGPDAAASGRLYSLFAHLASFAQLADAAEGGCLLDGSDPDLLPMLDPGARALDTSSLYRTELAGRPAGEERVRVLHVASPASELQRRVLSRVGAVWLVLPAAMPAAEADAYAAAVLAATGDAPVVLVVDGPEGPPPPDRLPEAWKALVRRPYRARHLDLAGLSARYLAGGVDAAEAAALVRWLTGDLVAPPRAEPSSETPALSQGIPAPPPREQER